MRLDGSGFLQWRAILDVDWVSPDSRMCISKYSAYSCLGMLLSEIVYLLIDIT